MRKALFLALIATGCYDTSSAPSCRIQCSTDTDCTDGLTCGAGGLCTDGEDCLSPNMCTPDEFIACVGDMAKSCNATGDGTTDTACTSGCNTTERRCNDCVPDAMSCSGDMMALQQCMPNGREQMVVETCAAGCAPAADPVAAHCRYLSPAWLPDVCDTPATVDNFAPNANATISTSLDTSCDQIVVQMQNGSPIGPQICVIRAKTITIPNGITTTFTGNRVIALVADSQLTINGTLDVSADQTANSNGPGAFGTSGVASTAMTAGGGGGFGTAGGAGGGAGGTGTGGAGGPAIDPLARAFFAGGTRGGTPNSGPIVDLNDIAGGGGGGGALVIACRGSVTLAGVIDANGAGGRGNRDTVGGPQLAHSDGASGGGTGGFVVVQGFAINVTGGIFANGGGGGAGTNGNDTSGPSGSKGQRSSNAATGGSALSTGGSGGFGTTSGQPGTGATAGGGYAAGGGGGAGVIHMYTPTGTVPTTTGANISPTFTRRPSILR